MSLDGQKAPRKDPAKILSISLLCDKKVVDVVRLSALGDKNVTGMTTK